jgi:signal transduction histidine kinase
VIAARRALSISRGTIAELAGEPPTTAKTALEAVARELAARFGAAIAVEANVSRDLAPEAREQLTRIAREAVVNACRHGRARQVSLSLSTSTDATVLRVTDDGRGIAARDAVDGFGMRTMRERAGALGARLSVRERVDGGTQLEVVVP